MQGTNIFLTGFMGSGKSYWGRIWAQQSGYRFYDLDDVIETAQQKTIVQIFESSGEAYFRNLETATLQEFEKKQHCIIACGGGTPCFNNNMQWMNAHGTTLYLKATALEIINRVRGEQEHRPLIKNLPAEELLPFIQNKLQQREPFYIQAKYVLPVSTLTAATINTFL